VLDFFPGQCLLELELYLIHVNLRVEYSRLVCLQYVVQFLETVIR
jgi:hypothetical protein